MNKYLNEIIFNIDDFKITVGKILLIVGILIASRIVLFLLDKILKSFFKKKGIDPNRSQSIYLLVKYFFWCIAIVTTLEIAGIQVTIFIAGSAALLVGLGLGLQQIFQDLVSGVFILMEGTIKVNDIIELDGVVGTIVSINLRTSEIITRDGIVIIVPNHKFIVESITNWTHNSQTRRFKVEVGVAYGSDVEKVRNILVNCAIAHEKILKGDSFDGQAPFLRFEDFGDSALKFELFFWTSDVLQVEFIRSDLRFAIEKKFVEEGITIPFPQRDVHIKTQ